MVCSLERFGSMKTSFNKSLCWGNPVREDQLVEKLIKGLVLLAICGNASDAQTGADKVLTAHESGPNGAVNVLAFPGSDIGVKLNNAIDTVRSSCGSVALPSGSYRLRTQVLKPRCVWIEGNNAQITSEITDRNTPAIVTGSLDEIHIHTRLAVFEIFGYQVRDLMVTPLGFISVVQLGRSSRQKALKTISTVLKTLP